MHSRKNGRRKGIHVPYCIQALCEFDAPRQAHHGSVACRLRLLQERNGAHREELN